MRSSLNNCRTGCFLWNMSCKTGGWFQVEIFRVFLFWLCDVDDPASQCRCGIAKWQCWTVVEGRVQGIWVGWGWRLPGLPWCTSTCFWLGLPSNNMVSFALCLQSGSSHNIFSQEWLESLVLRQTKDGCVLSVLRFLGRGLTGTRQPPALWSTECRDNKSNTTSIHVSHYISMKPPGPLSNDIRSTSIKLPKAAMGEHCQTLYKAFWKRCKKNQKDHHIPISSPCFAGFAPPGPALWLVQPWWDGPVDQLWGVRWYSQRGHGEYVDVVTYLEHFESFCVWLGLVDLDGLDWDLWVVLLQFRQVLKRFCSLLVPAVLPRNWEFLILETLTLGATMNTFQNERTTWKPLGRMARMPCFPPRPCRCPCQNINHYFEVGLDDQAVFDEARHQAGYISRSIYLRIFIQEL